MSYECLLNSLEMKLTFASPQRLFLLFQTRRERRRNIVRAITEKRNLIHYFLRVRYLNIS